MRSPAMFQRMLGGGIRLVIMHFVFGIRAIMMMVADAFFMRLLVRRTEFMPGRQPAALQGETMQWQKQQQENAKKASHEMSKKKRG